MVASVSLTAIYEVIDNGWVQARLEEIPAVITCAPTRAEAEELLLDAIREYLLSFSELDSNGDPVNGSRGSVNITLETR
jgi:hypothetical protein